MRDAGRRGNCETAVSKIYEPLILSLETATRAGSLALARGGRVIASRAGDPAVSHSTNLLGDVDALLKETGCGLGEVELFAAASGPGSFTGLRIGLATVKALAATLERKCAGVPTLEAVAFGAGPSSLTLALLPAGRGEVFAQLFSVEANGVVHTLCAPAHLPPRQLFESVRHERKLKWAGEGALLLASEIKAAASDNDLGFVGNDLGFVGEVELLQDERATGQRFINSSEKNLEATSDAVSNDLNDVWILKRPCALMAEQVAVLAAQRFQRGETLSPDELRAIYVRPSDAELHEHAQNILRSSG